MNGREIGNRVALNLIQHGVARKHISIRTLNHASDWEVRAEVSPESPVFRALCNEETERQIEEVLSQLGFSYVNVYYWTGDVHRQRFTVTAEWDK